MRYNKVNQKVKIVSISLISGIATLLIMGIVSAIIPNNFFTRMTEVTLWDWFILITTAILISIYIFFIQFKKNKISSQATCSAYSGSIFGFLTFGCALCNKLLIIILGATGVSSYFMPIQPFLGVIGISLLLFAIFKQLT